jgi:hypothetical protein
MKTLKQNCWEFQKCGREPGGEKNEKLGICLASVESRTNGIHGGKNGGRACWAIAGTLCEGKVQGSIAKKIGDCLKCEFYKQVIREEGSHFNAKEIFFKLWGNE